ncbi:MAG: ATPase, T2SS/T4P/T4SS family [archaeon]
MAKKRVRKKKAVRRDNHRRKFRGKMKKLGTSSSVDFNKNIIRGVKGANVAKRFFGSLEGSQKMGVEIEEVKGKVLEEYEIEVDGAKVGVRIVNGNFGVVYNLIIPKVSAVTEALLVDLRNELVSATTVSMKEILDPSAFEGIKKKFIVDAERILKEKLPNTTEETKNFLIGKLIQEMLGLGEIEFMVNDPNLEEIVILSSKETIRVYHKKYKWIRSNIILEREDRIVNYSKSIARRVGREITVLSPLLDAHLVSGDRVNSVLYPISTNGNTITIRKFARDPYTIVDLISNKTCSIDVACLLWLAIEYEMNVLISGGTASGKTVLLNVCMPFIPPNHRIVSVEDTRELMLPDFLYWTPLVTRSANPEGKGEVSMLDLLVNSLRMRPDRIVMGEMRRKEEAMVLFEAMHTGHSVYATLHADSAAETISRLTNPPLSVPSNLLSAVNLNVVMFRDRRKGIRRILQVAEFEAGEDRATANILYRWIPEGDKMIQHNESSRFFEQIIRMTGMTSVEIRANLAEKMKVLSWLVDNKIRDLKSIGKVMNVYYSNKELLMGAIKKNDRKFLSDEI